MLSYKPDSAEIACSFKDNLDVLSGKQPVGMNKIYFKKEYDKNNRKKPHDKRYRFINRRYDSLIASCVGISPLFTRSSRKITLSSVVSFPMITILVIGIFVESCEKRLKQENRINRITRGIIFFLICFLISIRKIKSINYSLIDCQCWTN